ncbi:hypothetical protein LEP1GSC133_5210 [Leptospira borgpetersenii serovar Pomona str. 200901868]|uniref:Uncharacterized protein n=1 Tax=Leptospira borgpetersenii serovar Pomona str. 200901868 TaxID=1192866 RepID=M6W0P7_LEPBO|nr:hypothetical protein LEP1GSC133_5210 [Leptospira borgpetersenii serovar Pomona str. 200901868]
MIIYGLSNRFYCSWHSLAGVLTIPRFWRRALIQNMKISAVDSCACLRVFLSFGKNKNVFL